MISVSVVIPTYNRATLLAETLDSVFAQTLVPHEVIVVDDGSTDHTAEVMERYEERVIFIRLENGGPLIARNAGLRAAAGQLVAFCDSDDLWSSDYLLTMSDVWKMNPDVGAAFSNFRILENGELSERTKFSDAPPLFWDGFRYLTPDTGIFDAAIVENLLAFQPFFPSAMTVNRVKFLELGGWDEGVSGIVGSDFATVLHVGMTIPIGVCHLPLVSIRKHTSNFSGNIEKMNLGNALILEHFLEMHPEISDLRKAFRCSINQRRADALSSAFSRRDFQTVRGIHGLVGNCLPVNERVKAAISSLPPPIATLLANALSK